MKILSLITHLHVTPNLYAVIFVEHKGRVLEESSHLIPIEWQFIAQNVMLLVSKSVGCLNRVDYKKPLLNLWNLIYIYIQTWFRNI